MSSAEDNLVETDILIIWLGTQKVVIGWLSIKVNIFDLHSNSLEIYSAIFGRFHGSLVATAQSHIE